MGVLVNAAERLGETGIQEALIETALARADLPDLDRGQFLCLRGFRQVNRGDVAAARASLEAALTVFQRIGHQRQIAVTRGVIADILQAQGDLGEARRIREQEELLVYEALGDRRGVAVTRQKLAQILQAQGDLGEALRIYEQECLPVYEALGARRDIAVIRLIIASILLMQGDLREASLICERECLPVFEALGDRRQIMVTRGRIAECLQAEGDLDGAIQMHLSRAPIAKGIGDTDSLAHIRFRCAEIRLAQGNHDRGGLRRIRDELNEALRINSTLGRRDYAGMIHELLGEVLAVGGQREGALCALARARETYHEIDDGEGVRRCTSLIGRLGGGQD